MRCPECDAKVSPKDKRCPECGEKLKAGGVERIVPYRNLPALIGYYVGVAALIPFLSFVLAPIAILLGVYGIVYGVQNPRAKAPGHSITAIVLSLIGLVGTGVMIFLIKNDFLANPLDRLRGK
jgi:hypothetical protein